VVVHNFHVVGVSFVPTKADAILVVNPDAVLPDPILQSFKPVPWACKKVGQPRRGIQGVQPAPRGGLNIHKADYSFSAKQLFGIGTAERLNHYRYRSTRFTENGNTPGLPRDLRQSSVE